MNEVRIRIISILATIFVFLSALTAQNSPRRRTINLLTQSQIVWLLQNRDKVPCSDINPSIRSTLNFNPKDTTSLRMPDSLNGVYTIQNIITKKNNYILRNGKLYRKKIYIIDIRDDIGIIPHLCIISPESKFNGKKLKKGDTINTTLYPCFPFDNFRLSNGYKVLPSLHQYSWIILDSILIDNFPYNYRNYVLFPNP